VFFCVGVVLVGCFWGESEVSGGSFVLVGCRLWGESEVSGGSFVLGFRSVDRVVLCWWVAFRGARSGLAPQRVGQGGSCPLAARAWAIAGRAGAGGCAGLAQAPPRPAAAGEQRGRRHSRRPASPPLT
jgi:hypothetical protein